MALRSAVLVVFAVLAAIPARAQTKSPVEGVWKVAEVQVTGGQTPGNNTSPQPGLYIFTRGHYSIMTIGTDKPRAAIPFQASVATDKEKLALYDHWAQFTANSGTYTIAGSTITTKPLVAKNEGVMQGGSQTRDFKIEGNTLWLVQKGGPAGATTETRTKLSRVE